MSKPPRIGKIPHPEDSYPSLKDEDALHSFPEDAASESPEMASPPPPPPSPAPPFPAPSSPPGRGLESEVIVSEPAQTISSASLLKKGNLAYSIPSRMSVNKSTRCVVRIAGKEVKKAELQIGESTEFQPITISDEMSVELMDNAGGSDFKIVALSDETQIIWEGQYTEWLFDVTPILHDHAAYILSLKVKMHVNGKTRSIPLIEKSIDVKGSAQKRIVFMAADTGFDLNVNNEAKYIEEQLKQGNNRFQYSAFSDLTAFKLSEILLQEDPSILHYAGHSAVEGIFLFDDEGQVVLANTNAIQQLFKAAKSKLKLECFVLNSCFSQAQAFALKEYSPFLIGTTSAIPDEDAQAFSKSFYQALASGLGYKEAYNAALAVLNIDLQDEAQRAIYNYYASS